MENINGDVHAQLDELRKLKSIWRAAKENHELARAKSQEAALEVERAYRTYYEAEIKFISSQDI